MGVEAGRDHRLRWGLVGGVFVVMAACSAPQTPSTLRSEAVPVSDQEPVPQVEETSGTARVLAPWQRALFPEQIEGDVRSGAWHDEVILQIGGRDYGSSLWADDAAAVSAVIAPLALRPSSPNGLRFAFVGVGAGTELATALSLEPNRVDLFEPRAELLERAWDVIRENALTADSGLNIEEGTLVHPRLTITRAPGREDVEEPRYDVIVHPVGMSVLSGPRRLFVRERLEALRGLLAPGGRLMLHLQLSHVRSETVQTMLRTVAAVFASVLVIASTSEGRDAIIVCGNEPLAFHVPTLRALQTSVGGGRSQLLAGLHRPMDIAGRTLFRDREAVLSYAGEGPVYTSSTPMGVGETPPLPPMEAENPTDADADAWNREYQSYLTRHRFEEDFHLGFYSESWPHGRLCELPPDCALLSGRGEEAEAVTALAELGFSRFLFTGRAVTPLMDAVRALVRARGRRETGPDALVMYAHLQAEADPPFRARDWPASAAVRRRLLGLERLFSRGDHQGAAARITELLREREVPVGLHPMAELYWAYATLQNGNDRMLAELQDTLIEFPSLILDHPELLILLARCQFRAGQRLNAVRTLESALELQRSDAPSHRGAR